MHKLDGGRNLVLSLYLFSSFGYFGFLSIMVLLCSMASISSDEIAMVTAAFFLSSNLSKILIGGVLERVGIKNSLLLGCLLCCLGLAIISLFKINPFLIAVVGVVIYGFGTSICGIANKQLTAAVTDSNVKEREHTFSKVVVAINLSSAISSPISINIAHSYGALPSLLYISSFYILTFFVVFVFYPNHNLSIIPSEKVTRGFLKNSFGFIKGKNVFLMLTLNAFFWFLYSHLFSVVALYMSVVATIATKYSLIISLNALFVIIFQIPITVFFKRRGNVSMNYCLPLSFLIFSASFIFLIKLNYSCLIIFIAFFSFGEIFFSPFFDGLYLYVIGTSSRGVAYSCLALSTALGEVLGSGLGVYFYNLTSGLSNTWIYWLVISILSFLFSFCATCIVRKVNRNNISNSLIA